MPKIEDMKKRLILKIFLMLIGLGILAVVGVLLVSWRVVSVGEKYVYTTENVRPGDAIIVLGAYVEPSGEVSWMLKDRLDFALQLYNLGKAPKIIVSGDHGQKSYDEVNAMRKYLLDREIPSEDIFMDHAGFNTYNSMYRARDIFEVKKPIIVSQRYHVVRASYIAKMLGMDAAGVGADTHRYPGMEFYEFREYGARLRAFWDCLFHTKPKLLGETIPVWGNGEATLD